MTLDPTPISETTYKCLHVDDLTGCSQVLWDKQGRHRWTHFMDESLKDQRGDMARPSYLGTKLGFGSCFFWLPLCLFQMEKLCLCWQHNGKKGFHWILGCTWCPDVQPFGQTGASKSHARWPGPWRPFLGPGVLWRTCEHSGLWVLWLLQLVSLCLHPFLPLRVSGSAWQAF